MADLIKQICKKIRKEYPNQRQQAKKELTRRRSRKIKARKAAQKEARLAERKVIQKEQKVLAQQARKAHAVNYKLNLKLNLKQHIKVKPRKTYHSSFIRSRSFTRDINLEWLNESKFHIDVGPHPGKGWVLKIKPGYLQWIKGSVEWVQPRRKKKNEINKSYQKRA